MTNLENIAQPAPQQDSSLKEYQINPHLSQELDTFASGAGVTHIDKTPLEGKTVSHHNSFLFTVDGKKGVYDAFSGKAEVSPTFRSISDIIRDDKGEVTGVLARGDSASSFGVYSREGTPLFEADGISAPQIITNDNGVNCGYITSELDDGYPAQFVRNQKGDKIFQNPVDIVEVTGFDAIGNISEIKVMVYNNRELVDGKNCERYKAAKINIASGEKTYIDDVVIVSA